MHEALLRETRDHQRPPFLVAPALCGNVHVVAERRGGGSLNRAGHHQAGVLAHLAQVPHQIGIAGHESGPEPGHVRPFRQ